MKQSSRRSTLVALLLLTTCADAWAQLATAQMNGRVTDESGAVLPGGGLCVRADGVRRAPDGGVGGTGGSGGTSGRRP